MDNGKDCNCYCFCCKQDLIAVNQEIKQKAHFRHSPEADCAFRNNFESYIHWLAKEVFKEIEYINLPPISFSALQFAPGYHNNLIAELKKRLAKVGILDKFQNTNLNLYNTVLQIPKSVKIESCEIEKTFTSTLGDIRVDIVLSIAGNPLFIEPFFTNSIDNEKFNKIRALDISTISINLLEFVRKNESSFTISEFKNFLSSSVSHKKWVYVRNKKAEYLSTSLFNENFDKKLIELTNTINKDRAIEEDILKQKEIADKAHVEIIKLTDSLKKVDVLDAFNLFKP